MPALKAVVVYHAQWNLWDLELRKFFSFSFDTEKCQSASITNKNVVEL